jgi:hypothetical protein
VPEVVERVKPTETLAPETYAVTAVFVGVIVANAAVTNEPVGVITYAPPIVVGQETVPITAAVRIADPLRVTVNVPVAAAATTVLVTPAGAVAAAKVQVEVMSFNAGPAVTV